MRTDDVRVALYRSFVQDARAPRPEELAASTGLSLDETQAVLRQLAADDVIAFRPGTEDLWLAHPFCATDAPFEVRAGDRKWDAICVWDALGILALMESDGVVTTSCPDCGESLQLRVGGGEISGPPDAVVHFGVPVSRWYEDIGYT